MRRPPSIDLYALLGVSPTADVKEIRQAWRTKIAALHPDRRPGDMDAHNQAALLNLARDILTDPVHRTEYNLHRRDQQRRQAGQRRSSTSGPRHEPPPPPPPPPSPPPAPPRIVLEPSEVDFGTVRLGAMPAAQTVTIRMSDGSPLGRVGVLHHWGRFWTNEQYDETEGCKAFTVIFQGRQVTNLEPGGHEDMAEILVGDERFLIRVRIDVEAVPEPRRPGPSDAPPRAPEPEPTPSRSGPVPPPRRPFPAPPRLLAMILVLTVLLGVGAWLMTDLQGVSGRPPAAAPAPIVHPSASPYCKIQFPNQTIGYYRVQPGTTQALSTTPVWSISGPNWSDQWVAWLTPGFPHWEEANLSDGYSPDGGQTGYAALTYVETAPYPLAPYIPQAQAFQENPRLDHVAESSMRQKFLSEWIKYLKSPPCAN